MRSDEYRALDAVAIDESVAAGHVSSAELALTATAEHERWHRAINAVVEWYADPLPSRTVAAPVPALRGVPMLRKDYGSAEAGRLVEMGSRLALGQRAAATAPYIESLAAAGVQIMGRSAVPEFIQHGVTESRVHGETHNPWDPDVSAGGSSGGAAAAVAAGVVPIAHASDCAGSIRIPASTCGLVGLKPGLQRVPWAQDWDGIAQEFVVCRTVRDARRCLEVLGSGSYLPVRETTTIALSTTHWAGAPEDADVVAATEHAARLLEQLGHRVVPVEQPVDYPTMMRSWPVAFSRFALADAERLASATGRPLDHTTLEPMTLAAVDSVRSLTKASFVESRTARHTVVNRLNRDLAAYDVIMTPTLGRVTIPTAVLGGEADPADYFAGNDEIFPYSYLFNLAGWPSITIPAGTDARGHPIGVQLSARVASEHVLLMLAEAVERAQPWPLVAPWPTP